MVHVELPAPLSDGSTDLGTRQTSHDSEYGSLTLFSSTAESSRNGHAIPHSTFTFECSFDPVRPSVEYPPTDEGMSAPSTPVAQVPSLSVTPSGSVSRDAPNLTTAGRDDTVNSLDAQLQGLRFSTSRRSMDMTSISNALQKLMTGRDSRSSPLLDPVPRGSISQSLGRRSTHRRRSSSRSNLGKHDVKDEAPPNDRFNLPGFQKALRDTRKSMADLADVLGSSVVGNRPGSVMKRLHDKAKDLSQFECPSKRTVGLVGGSGVGKSSLLNSLLDYRDLARSSSGGGACTCVVTEFHFHEDEKFVIVVERFSEAELMSQLESLLQDYRNFHLNSGSNNEVADPKERAGISCNTFQAMFPKFAQNNTFLQDTEQESLSTLKSWVQSFDQSIIPEGQSGLSLDECSSLLMQLSSNRESRRPLWPWVKKIMVYLNAHILSKGLILVDLPGLRDLNAARQNITERYLLKCNEIFVVAAEDRATTDEGVRSAVELVTKAQLSNLSIICTKSDKIKPEEALKDLDGTSDAKEIRKKLEVIEREESLIIELEQRMEKRYDDIDHPDLVDEKLEELRHYQRRLRSSRKELSDSEFDLQKFLITTRNAIVEGKLVDLYRREVPGNLLEVFCVSNEIYWEWREEPRDESEDHLMLSGILTLRQHCMSMVSESQYIAAKKYMRDDMGALLGELDLWLQQGSLNAEGKGSIRRTLDTLEKELYLKLCGRASGLNIANSYKREFDAELYRPQADRVGRWSTAAKSARDKWAGWHHTSYAVFCDNYGSYSTGRVGSHNWNEELIAEMVNDLSPLWEQLQLSLDQRSEAITEFIDSIFDGADEFLRTGLNEFPDTALPIASTILSQRRVLEADIKTILDDLQGDLRTLRTDALSGIRTSFIGKAMEDAYEEARRVRGDRSYAKKKAIIDSAVERHGLFADMLKSFKRGFNEYVDDAQERLREAASSHLGAIKGTFDIVRSDNVALECEKDPDFSRRVEKRLAATKEEIEKVHDAIAA